MGVVNPGLSRLRRSDPGLYPAAPSGGSRKNRAKTGGGEGTRMLFLFLLVCHEPEHLPRASFSVAGALRVRAQAKLGRACFYLV